MLVVEPPEEETFVAWLRVVLALILTAPSTELFKPQISRLILHLCSTSSLISTQFICVTRWPLQQSIKEVGRVVHTLFFLQDNGPQGVRTTLAPSSREPRPKAESDVRRKSC